MEALRHAACVREKIGLLHIHTTISRASVTTNSPNCRRSHGTCKQVRRPRPDDLGQHRLGLLCAPTAATSGRCQKSAAAGTRPGAGGGARAGLFGHFLRQLAAAGGIQPDLEKIANRWCRKASLASGLFGFPCGTMDGGWYNDPGYEMGSHAVCCGADGFLPYGRAGAETHVRPGFRRDLRGPGHRNGTTACRASTGTPRPGRPGQRTYDWFAEVTRTTRARRADAYTIAELPDLYNTQHIDVWWNWMWRDAAWANPRSVPLRAARR